MKEERRDTLMAATYGTRRIAEICAEIKLDLMRLSEFEDGRIAEIIVGLAEKTAEISSHCVTITAICRTVADGKSGLKNVEKTIEKSLKRIQDRESANEDEEEETFDD